MIEVYPNCVLANKEKETITQHFRYPLAHQP